MAHLLIWGIAIFLICVVIAVVSNPDANNNSNNQLLSKHDSSLNKGTPNNNNSTVSGSKSRFLDISDFHISDGTYKHRSKLGPQFDDFIDKKKKEMADFYEAGMKAKYEGNLKKALDLFDNAISLSQILKEPNANYYNYRALVHVEFIGQQRKKMADLFEAGKKAKSEGNARTALYEFDKAISCSEIIKEPNANFYYYRALVHVELVGYIKAIDDYSKAISLEPLHIYYNNIFYILYYFYTDRTNCSYVCCMCK
jgi:tetratricopeptide (TPR) repeat protein